MLFCLYKTHKRTARQICKFSLWDQIHYISGSKEEDSSRKTKINTKKPKLRIQEQYHQADLRNIPQAPVYFTRTGTLILRVQSIYHPGNQALSHSLYINTHTHKPTNHHPSITLTLPLPFLLFYAQSKSREVGSNMWAYPVV